LSIGMTWLLDEVSRQTSGDLSCSFCSIHIVAVQRLTRQCECSSGAFTIWMYFDHAPSTSYSCWLLMVNFL
jgi:hypothetical protein